MFLDADSGLKDDDWEMLHSFIQETSTPSNGPMVLRPLEGHITAAREFKEVKSALHPTIRQLTQEISHDVSQPIAAPPLLNLSVWQTLCIQYPTVQHLQRFVLCNWPLFCTFLIGWCSHALLQRRTHRRDYSNSVVRPLQYWEISVIRSGNQPLRTRTAMMHPGRFFRVPRSHH